MALQGAIPVEFGAAFPHGAFVVGEVMPVNDFEKSTKEKPVQQRDKNTGMPLWTVPVLDPDPDARKGQREINIKVAAEFQPVPPDTLPGLPFRPAEFTGLTVTPYLDENGHRAKVAYSYRATGMHAPGGAAHAVKAPQGEKAAA